MNCKGGTIREGDGWRENGGHKYREGRLPCSPSANMNERRHKEWSANYLQWEKGQQGVCTGRIGYTVTHFRVTLLSQ